MAERRMFSKTIVQSDRFLALSERTQLLYFHLGMNADDDGFIGSPRMLLRALGCDEEALAELVQAKLIYIFPEGPVVIRHWKLQNRIRTALHKPTIYIDELEQLEEIVKGIYTLKQ